MRDGGFVQNVEVEGCESAVLNESEQNHARADSVTQFLLLQRLVDAVQLGDQRQD